MLVAPKAICQRQPGTAFYGSLLRYEAQSHGHISSLLELECKYNGETWRLATALNSIHCSASVLHTETGTKHSNRRCPSDSTAKRCGDQLKTRCHHCDALPTYTMRCTYPTAQTRAPVICLLMLSCSAGQQNDSVRQGSSLWQKSEHYKTTSTTTIVSGSTTNKIEP